MKVEYKQIKTTAPHCGDCKERLSGNNSFVFPYKCSCGTWKRIGTTNEFKIKQ